MAHTGFLYPIEQRVRYIHNQQAWAYWAAKSYRCRGAFWVGTIPLPPHQVWFDAVLYNWTPGDAFLEYRGDIPTSGPEHVEIGWRYELTEPYFQSNRRWATVWVDGVNQYAWDPVHDNPPFAMTPIIGGGPTGHNPGWVLGTLGSILCLANGY